MCEEWENITFFHNKHFSTTPGGAAEFRVMLSIHVLLNPKLNILLNIQKNT